MRGLLQSVVLHAERPLGDVTLSRCFGQRFCAGRDVRVLRFRCLWSAAAGWAVSRAEFDPALRDLVGAMVGPAKVVAALLGERRRCGRGRRRERKSVGAVNNAE